VSPKGIKWLQVFVKLIKLPLNDRLLIRLENIDCDTVESLEMIILPR
jgi:hypothetical protein